MSEDLLKQVQSEMRAETALRLARRHAALCCALMVLALVGLGVWLWHRHTLRQSLSAASTQFYTASMELSQPDTQEGVKKAMVIMGNLSRSAPGQMRFFAAIQLAEAHLKQGDFKSASDILLGVASDQSAKPIYQSYARYLRLNAASALRALPASEIRSGYEILARDGGPWRAFAQEGLLASDLEPNSSAARQAEARQLADSLARNPDVPPSIRQRAATVTSILKAQRHD